MTDQLRRRRNVLVGVLAIDIAVGVAIMVGFAHGRYYGMPAPLWRGLVVVVILILIVDVTRAARLSKELDRAREANPR
jgi:uncharacterized membrane protein